MLSARRVLPVVLFISVSCSPTRGCVESHFELAPESRLPAWLNVSSIANRADVTLELYYYVPPLSAVDDTVFVATIAGNKRQMSGRHWWHPKTEKQLDAYYATEPRPVYPNPSYVVIEVEGVVDVIEHRESREQNREPGRALFWMADDPEILKEAREFASTAGSQRR